jgi:hypothetical protein
MFLFQKAFLFLFFVGCALIGSINSEPTLQLRTIVKINLTIPPTLLSNQTSMSCWVLYPLKLPKTTASTTIPLMASTGSSSAEVMLTLVPAKAVSAMRVNISQVSVHLIQLPSSGSMNAC